MSDFKSQLPVKTLNNGDVKVNVVDGTVPSQLLKVNADGSVPITDNGGSLTVDANDLDIRDLTSATDSVSVLQSAHDNLNANANLQVNNLDVADANPVPMSDAGGSLTVDSTNLDVRDLTHTRDTVKIADAAGDILGIESNGHISVRLFDQASNPYSLTNPLAVVVSDDKGGDEIVDYKTTTDVAAGSTTTHAYTVTAGKTLLITGLLVSASGAIKGTLSIGASARVAVFNSSANPNTAFVLPSPIKVTAGTVVNIVIENRDENPFDVYSTLFGQEV